MDVFFETQSGNTFSIELGYWDTVLEIKQKIEKYQRIPVSKQTLFFQGEVLLQDDLDMVKCEILHNSRLQLFVYPDLYSNPNPNGDQMVETEQSQVPLNSIGDLIYGEDLPLTTEDFMNIRAFLPPKTTEDVLNGLHQDSPVRNKDQSPPLVAAKQNGHHQASPGREYEHSPPSDAAKHNGHHQDSPVRINDQSPPSVAAKQNGHHKDDQYPPSNAAKQNGLHQDSPVRNKDQSPPLVAAKQNGHHQDSPVRINDQSPPSVAAKQNGHHQDDQYPPSNAAKQNGLHQDSPVRNNDDHSPPTVVEAKQNGHHQDSPVRNNDQPPTSVAAKQITNGHPQDSTVTVLQELQTEQSPASNSVKEKMNIQDSPVNVRNNMKSYPGKPIGIVLYVLPYSGVCKEALTLKTNVYTKCLVKVLRCKSTQKRLRGHLDLPQDTYFFVHKQRVLSEDRSFEWNGIAHNDTIQIVRDPWLNK